MPTYKYRREDGTTFTIRQKITEDALEECPETGQKVERVITGGVGFRLKGGGWYADGYSSNGTDDGASPDEGAGKNASEKNASEKSSSGGSAPDAGNSGKSDAKKSKTSTGSDAR